MTRRTFVSSLSAAAALGAAPAGDTIQVHVAARGEAIPISSDFLGLGFEISSVATEGLLSSRNRVYIQLLRTLSRSGVIRVGGNTSDFAGWSANGPSVALPKGTIVTPRALDELGGFLRATGWKLIWGLNLGTGTPESAAEEAAAVARAAGDRLIAFEVGNEPDLFVQQGHRQPGYGYPQYLAEFKRFAASLPAAPIAGPDVMDATDWVRSFAHDVQGVRLLTQHYYRSVVTDPAATIENLLLLDARFVRVITDLQSIGRGAAIPYRLVELNSFAGGGKPGVSDTFASALWGLDLMFTLAAAGGNGINWETGINHLGFVSSYSPIFTDDRGNPSARPLYYALLAFREAAGGRLIHTDYNPGGVNARVHAFRNAAGVLWVVVINKDLSATATLEINVDEPVTQAEFWPLSAPNAESRDGVTLAGAAVSSSGMWAPRRRERVAPVRQGQVAVVAPPAQALLIACS